MTMAAAMAMVMAMASPATTDGDDDDPVSRPTVRSVSILCFNIFQILRPLMNYFCSNSLMMILTI